MIKRFTFASVLVAMAIFALAAGASAAKSPYSRLPAVGDVVRFNGPPTEKKQAWAYADRNWLEQFLQITIQMALSNSQYDPTSHSPVKVVTDHASTLDNGIGGVVQHVEPYHYRDHEDVEVQVRVTSGPLRNRLLWTTPAELADSKGNKYLK